MRISFVGFMGSGKTTVSRLTADILGHKHVEMDEEIIRISKRSNIPEIFKIDGEARFREIEAEVVHNLDSISDIVISTGGGVIQNMEIIKSLKNNNGIILWLKTSFDTVKSRVMNFNDRPLFQDVNSAFELYQKRLPLYEANADIIIETDNLSIEEVVAKVINKLQSADN